MPVQYYNSINMPELPSEIRFPTSSPPHIPKPLQHLPELRPYRLRLDDSDLPGIVEHPREERCAGHHGLGFGEAAVIDRRDRDALAEAVEHLAHLE